MHIKPPVGGAIPQTPSVSELGDRALASIKAATPDMDPAFWQFSVTNQLSQLNGVIPTLAELQALGAELSRDPSLPFDYITDGCLQRAQSMGATIAARGINCATLDITSEKTELGAANAFMATRWGHHIAPCVFARHPDTGAIEAFIVDPSMRRDAPVMPIAEWLADFASITTEASLVLAPLTPPTDETRAQLKTFAETFDHFAQEPTSNFERFYKTKLYQADYGPQTLPTKRDFVQHNYVATAAEGDPANAYRVKPRDGSERFQAVVTEDATHATISAFNFAPALPELEKTTVRQQLLAHLSIGKEVVRTPDGRVNLAQVPANDPLTQFVLGPRAYQCWPNTPNLIGKSGGEEYIGYCRSVPSANAFDMFLAARNGNDIVLKNCPSSFSRAEIDAFGKHAAHEMGWPCENVVVDNPASSQVPGFLDAFLRDHVELALSGARYALSKADGSTRVAATLELEQSFNVRDVSSEPGVSKAERDRVVRSMARYASLLEGKVLADPTNEMTTHSMLSNAGHVWMVEPAEAQPSFRATFIGGLAAPMAGAPLETDATHVLLKELWFADDVPPDERAATLQTLKAYLLARGWQGVTDVSADPLTASLMGDIGASAERLASAPIRPPEDLYGRRWLAWFALEPGG